MPVATRSQAPALMGPYSPPPSSRASRPRPHHPTTDAVSIRAGTAHPSRPSQKDTFGVFWGGAWLEVDEEMWREIVAGEEEAKKERRAKRLLVERRRCLGRKKKQRAFLGGRKGKVVEGGRMRWGKGERDNNGVLMGGKFRGRG